MQKIIALIFMIPVCLSSNAQEQNRVVFDSLKNQQIVEGYCTRTFLEGFAPFNQHFTEEYSQYTPALSETEKLPSLMEGVTITVVMASWCGDSREQLPRFFKVMDEAGYPSGALTLIGVNGSKTAPGIDLSSYAVKLVPTFIFYYQGKEIGRITETPVKSLETDILEILQKKNG
jgi:thiol-disulfide isomerase/thioredoxin